MAAVTLADGGVYKGELKSEAPHGQGSCSWSDGRSYDGEWRSGKMHGKGTFKAGQHTYVGAFFKVRRAGARGGSSPWLRRLLQGLQIRAQFALVSKARCLTADLRAGRAGGQGQVCDQARARRAGV